MSPRILEVERCPHCKAALERPVPRVCPACGGSIQKRYLTAGCLTSAPPPVLALALGIALLRGSCSAPALADERASAAAASAAGEGAGPRPAGSENARSGAARPALDER